MRVILRVLAEKVRLSPDALFLGSQERNNALCKSRLFGLSGVSSVSNDPVSFVSPPATHVSALASQGA